MNFRKTIQLNCWNFSLLFVLNMNYLLLKFILKRSNSKPPNYGFDVGKIGFLVENQEPIPNFLVIIGLDIRGFNILGLLMERIYRE